MTKYINEPNHLRLKPEGVEKPNRFDYLTPFDESDWHKAWDTYRAALASQPTFLKVGDGWERFKEGEEIDGGKVEINGTNARLKYKAHKFEIEAAQSALDKVIIPKSLADKVDLHIDQYSGAIVISGKHKEAGEESDTVKLYILSALDCLGHNDKDYAVGEGNIKDACIELEKALETYLNSKTINP